MEPTQKGTGAEKGRAQQHRALSPELWLEKSGLDFMEHGGERKGKEWLRALSPGPGRCSTSATEINTELS